MGQKPSISYRQNTGYHSYMSPNNKAFCRPYLSSSIDPRPLAIQSNTLEPACLTLDQLQRQAAGGSTRHVLKIARWLKAIDWQFSDPRIGTGVKVCILSPLQILF